MPNTLSLHDQAFDQRTRSEARERVEAAITELPELFRVVLVLADVAELTTAEIAAVLGIKEATVKTRLHRARLRVRAALAESLPQRVAPKPGHARKVCLDLLRAKLDAMDRHAPFPYSDQALCERCRIQLDLLDFAGGVCANLNELSATPELRRRVEALIESEAL
jgi:RNA polymerase sigma-70 factor, ECF subfamily